MGRMSRLTVSIILSKKAHRRCQMLVGGSSREREAREEAQRGHDKEKKEAANLGTPTSGPTQIWEHDTCTTPTQTWMLETAWRRCA